MPDTTDRPPVPQNGEDFWMVGHIYCRAKVNDGTGAYYPISLGFGSRTELAQVVKYIKSQGWEPFTDIIDLKVSDLKIPQPKQEEGPSCPYHGDEYLKPSKKRGWLFCSAKLKDGSYCKHTQPAP